MNQSINLILQKQREFFASGKTKNIDFRIEQLKALKKAIIKNESKILECLKLDLGKPEFQAYSSEIYFCLKEINNFLDNLYFWTNSKIISNSWFLFGSSSYVIQEPLGVVLIIAPWNYPFQLNFMPLIGAIAAGNCAVLKSSEFAPMSSQLIAQIISQTFKENYISVIQGESKVAQDLLEEKFDYIFFTGGPNIGKLVMQSAAKNLTPLTLELGGKNPCIVDTDISIDITAKRIITGKFSNVGQSCVAPDYIFVDKQIKNKLIESIIKNINNFYGINPQESLDYSKIVNERHFDRLVSLIENNKIIFGGKNNRDKLYISPTIIDLDQDFASNKLMQDEIFGPILPIISFDDIDQVIRYINSKPKPLALYVFSNNKELQKRVLEETSSGGACINNTTIQVANLNLPFGGVGQSGFGKYHSKESFDTFSNKKSIVKSSIWFDLPFWYPPYKRKLFVWLKKLLFWSEK